MASTDRSTEDVTDGGDGDGDGDGGADDNSNETKGKSLEEELKNKIATLEKQLEAEKSRAAALQQTSKELSWQVAMVTGESSKETPSLTPSQSQSHLNTISGRLLLDA